jgi:2-methylisocitrate lyase-like PEP mutase family enzyme
VHIEDQVFPKRASYHRNVEHVIPADEMISKIRAAIQARQDPDFLIIARTDAKPATGSLDECIRRCNSYFEAGADMVLPLRISDPWEAEKLRREVPDAPLVFLSYFGGLTVQQIESLGFRLVVYPHAAFIAGYAMVGKTYQQLKERSIVEAIDETEMLEMRSRIENLIGLPELWDIELQTTERTP